MVSAARSEFIAGLTAFAHALDEPAVIASNDVGKFLRRGMTVAAFNLLETFLEDRLVELALHVNSGSTQFLDLPDRLQNRSISQTLEVANARLRRGTYDLTELRSFSSNVGHSLNAVGSAMSLSLFTWLWSGSNVTAEDLSSMLSHFQVDKPWDAVREFAGQLGFPTVDADGDNIDFRQDLRALAAERHKSAHLARHPITSLWLRSAPDRILRLAVTLDILISMGAHLLRTGDINILAGRKWDPLSCVNLLYSNRLKALITSVVRWGFSLFRSFKRSLSTYHRFLCFPHCQVMPHSTILKGPSRLEDCYANHRGRRLLPR